ncbi:MAG: peptidoglycan L-alanyl-D-glutamate endopeptidase CwlK [Halioglobus sp.]|jgi:peptidoglycan L-alanyl-D-glutamate endopeptidase CwlK
MPKFSTRSTDNLDECHEDLVLLFTTIVEHYDCSVICGHRGETEQRKAYDDGKSTLTWPKSKHNRWPAMAADVTPYPLDWNDIGGMYLFAGWALCTADKLYREGKMTHRLRSGSDWDMDGKTVDQKFNDLVHFELIN